MMKHRFLKDLLRGAAALSLASAAMLCASVTAHADGTAVLETDGTLTLSGNVVKEDVQAYSQNGDVRRIVCEKGTVLPADSSWLFGFMKADEIDLSNADASHVTDMHEMFVGCEMSGINLSGFDTSAATDMHGMFNGCSQLTSLDVSGFDTSDVTDMHLMFYDCPALTSVDLHGLDASAAVNLSYMFYCDRNLTEIDLNGFRTSAVQNMNGMFMNCESLLSLDLSSFDTSNAVSMIETFRYCGALRSVDLSSFDTPNVTGMANMFWGCGSLEALDLSGFDTSNVTGMENMFYACEALTALDLSSFDTSGVTNMDNMFRECESLTALNLSSFDTSAVENMTYMFSGCKALTALDLSSFDTSAVNAMDCMFGECESLVSLDLQSFNTSNVWNMFGMFSECRSLSALNVKSFDTAAVGGMGSMFRNCESLTVLDLNSFSTDRLVYFDQMFNNCYQLQTIYVSDKWVLPENNYEYTPGFENCYALVGGNGTAYAEYGRTQVDMARIDRPDEPGYFTEKVYLPVDSVTLSKTAFARTGKQIKVGSYIKVKSGTTALRYGIDYTMSYADNTALGYQTASVTVTGIGDYSGTVTKYYSIVPAKLAAPALSVNGTALHVQWTANADADGYQVQYCQNSSFSSSDPTYHIASYGKSKTACDLTKYPKIGETWYVRVRAFVSSDGTTSGSKAGLWSDAKSLKLIGTVDTVTLSKTSFVYTGKEIKTGSYISVKSAGTALKYGTDFTLSYADNINTGTATVTVTGTGNYKGTITKQYTITRKAVTAAMISLTQDSFVYTGKEIRIGSYVKVKNGSIALKYGTDYTLSYADNVSIGTATVTVTGIGNYKGTASAQYQITGKPIDSVTLSKSAFTYTGKEIKVGSYIKVKSGSTALKYGTDYTMTYADNINAGTATVTVTGIGIYAGTVVREYTINGRPITGVTLSKAEFDYTGSAVKVDSYLTVMSGDNVLTKGTDYTLSYKDNVEAGMATVTIKGKGNYAGTVSWSYFIREN